MIETDNDIKRGLDALILIEPRFQAVREFAGEVPLRREAPTLGNFIRIVVGQQVSVASAKAIWERCQAGFDVNNAETIVRTSDDTLKAAGLSRPKIKTIRAIAKEVCEEDLDLVALANEDLPDLKNKLIRIHGVGPWTADIFALVCLGHPDVFPVGDIALQEAVKDIFDLSERPKGDDLLAITSNWSPHQAVAARLLWAYYGAVRKRTNPFPV